MRLILSLLSALCLLCTLSYGQSASADSARIKTVADTAAKKRSLIINPADTTKKKVPKPPYVHQLRLSLDISRIAFNLMFPSKQAYEVQADYLLRNKKLYLAAEAGFGKGKVDYDNLKYDNNGYFIRIGIDQQFLDIISAKDFDIGFIGVRYGMGVGKRSDATYLVPSPFGPSVEGSVPSQNFVVHWAEITGGIKVEVAKDVFVGWNVRGRFLLNPGIFKELSPVYIPGYGKGDKTTVFDFNFYVGYALRWGGK